jgi:plastocyanin
MKKFLFAILAVAVMFTACDDDEDEAFVDVDQLQGLTITDYNGFSGLTAVRNDVGDLKFDVTFVYDASVWVTFDSFKFYYTLNQDFTDAEWTAAIELDDEDIEPNLIADHRVSMEIDIVAADNMYSFTIPAADVKVGDDLRFYFRGYTKDVDGEKNKMYYTGTGDETFEKDIYSEWTVLTVK